MLGRPLRRMIAQSIDTSLRFFCSSAEASTSTGVVVEPKGGAKLVKLLTEEHTPYHVSRRKPDRVVIWLGVAQKICSETGVPRAAFALYSPYHPHFSKAYRLHENRRSIFAAQLAALEWALILTSDKVYAAKSLVLITNCHYLYILKNRTWLDSDGQRSYAAARCAKIMRMAESRKSPTTFVLEMPLISRRSDEGKTARKMALEALEDISGREVEMNQFASVCATETQAERMPRVTLAASARRGVAAYAAHFDNFDGKTRPDLNVSRIAAIDFTASRVALQLLSLVVALEKLARSESQVGKLVVRTTSRLLILMLAIPTARDSICEVPGTGRVFCEKFDLYLPADYWKRAVEVTKMFEILWQHNQTDVYVQSVGSLLLRAEQRAERKLEKRKRKKSKAG